MNIQPQHNYNSIAFNGLSQNLSKHLYNTEKIWEVVEKNPKSNGIVGSLPKKWIDKIPTEERAESIKEIYKCFAENFGISANKSLLQINLNVSKCLKKYGIIKHRWNVMVKNSGFGLFGNIFKLEEGKDSYAIKIFYAPKGLPNSLLSKHQHGNGCEQNTMRFISKNMSGDINVTKMHFGDLKNGLMFSNFINDNKTAKKEIKNNPLGMIFTDDHKNNRVGNIIIDVGGVDINPTIAYSKNKRYGYKMIMSRIDKKPEKSEKFINSIKKIKDDSSQKKDILYGISIARQKMLQDNPNIDLSSIDRLLNELKK